MRITGHRSVAMGYHLLRALKTNPATRAIPVLGFTAHTGPPLDGLLIFVEFRYPHGFAYPHGVVEPS